MSVSQNDVSGKPSRDESDDLSSNRFITAYSNFIYRFPYVVYIVILVFLFCMGFWFFSEYKLFINADEKNYRWSEVEDIDKWDAFVDASKQTYYSLREKNQFTDTIPTQTLQMPGVLLYERPGQNVLDIPVIQEIWKLEDKLWKTNNLSYYCLKSSVINEFDPLNGCKYFPSIISSIKQTMKSLGNMDPKPEDLTKQIIDTMLSVSNPYSGSIKAAYLGRDYSKTNTTQFLRTILTFGFPFVGYQNKKDRYSEQLNSLAEWGLEYILPIEEFNDQALHGLKAYGFVPGTVNKQLSQLIMNEMLWLGGSFGVSILIVIWHLKDFSLSVLGILGVVFSIPSALFVQYCIIGIESFDALNVLGLFLICGIGSDCIFIYFDLLRQTRNKGETKQKRFANTIQKGAFATAVSCLTTAICFVSLYTSGSRTLRFFGVFCFLEILFNWLFGFTWFAASLALWLKHYEPEDIEHETEKNPENDNKEEKSINEDLFAFLREKPTYNVKASNIELTSLNIYEKLFHNYISPFVYHYRLIVVTLILLSSVILSIYALKMEGRVEMQFLTDKHPMQHGYSITMSAFQTSPVSFSFNFVWGISPQVTVSAKDRKTPKNFGTATFLPFDLKNENHQQFLYDVCDIIENRTDIVNINTQNAVVCPIRLLKTFALSNSSTFPVPLTDYNRIMSGFQSYLSNNLGANEGDSIAGTSSTDTIGFDFKTNQIVYISAKANLILPDEMQAEYIRPVYEKVIALEKTINSIAPTELKGGFTTSYAWITMTTQEKIVTATYSGIISSLAFSVLIAFLSTMSLSYTAFFAFSLISVVTSVMGILQLFGWGIGLTEAVMLTIASGFCTDYIIHTMLHMARDNKISRFGKLQRSLTTFCTPVACAFLTTVGSVIFLYPSQIIIFPPFATFLILSSVFGLLHGFCVLPALASMIGPKGGDNLDTLCTKEQVSDLPDL